MMVYYNEFDKKPAAWLRELAERGHISKGVVDERSIKDVKSADLVGVERAHFFAGIGGWDYALKLAGWPIDWPVWTGSCPCQPFSSAGAGRGVDDPRHLWPDFARLIDECRPPVVFGEQVASPAGRDWLAGVRADLEGMGYEVGASDLCAASVGAPHIRQRLYWAGILPDAKGQRWNGLENSAKENWRDGAQASGGAEPLQHPAGHGREQRRAEPGGRGAEPRCGDGAEPPRHADATGLQAPELEDLRREGRREERGTAQQSDNAVNLQHTENSGYERGTAGSEGRQERETLGGGEDKGRGRLDFAHASPWSNYAILHFRDGKARRIEPGLEPLAHGVPARVGRLRGYGNAIVPQQAAPFIRSVIEYLKSKGA